MAMFGSSWNEDSNNNNDEGSIFLSKWRKTQEEKDNEETSLIGSKWKKEKEVDEHEPLIKLFKD